MQRSLGRLGAVVAAGALLILGASVATASNPLANSFTSINPALDCAATPAGQPGGCIVTKYGLGAPPDYAVGEPNATNPVLRSHESFAGSYFYRRSNPDPTADLGECIPEAAFAPVYGTLLLREKADCIPPALPATGQCRSCLGGTGSCTNGTSCSSIFDCPRGVCNNIDVGCPVEIPTDIATPGTDISFASLFQSVSAPGLFVLTSFNGALVTDGPALFTNPSRRAGLGRRLLRPAGGTEIIWVDLLNGGGNTVGENQSVLCCDDLANGATCASQPTPFQAYPTITSLPAFANEGRGEVPFIFPNDNPATGPVEGAFDSDQSYVVPGQVYGNCTVPLPAFIVSPDGVPRTVRGGCSAPGGLANRSCTGAGAPRPCCTGPRSGTCTNADSVAQCVGARNPYPCCTGAGAGNCGTECTIPLGGGNVFEAGPCNLSERGVRFNRLASSLPDGAPDPGKCNANPFRFKGTPNQNCSVIVFYNECLALSPQETCVLRGRCSNNSQLACTPGGSQCGAGTCNLGRTGRCSVSTDIRCSPGPSPLPLTPNGNARWGDPHQRCELANFGPQPRPDLNCDGVEDLTIDNNADGTADAIGDSCPYFTETNSVDVNPSPAVNTFNRDNAGRANECECGDSNRDGIVTVADIVDVNIKIFNPPGNQFTLGRANLAAPLSDSNEDNLINVSDIVATNVTIFQPRSSRCGRSPIIGE